MEHLCPPLDDRRPGRKIKWCGHRGDQMGVATGDLDLPNAEAEAEVRVGVVDELSYNDYLSTCLMFP